MVQPVNTTATSSWTVEKAALVKMVGELNLVPALSGVLSSEFFRISHLGKGKVRFAVASEIKGEFSIQGQGEWPFEKNFYLDRRVFVPFVLQASTIKSDAPFHFQRKHKALVISHGRRKAQFDGQPPLKGYGFDSEEEKEKIQAKLTLTEHVRFLIHCALNCATNDHTTPQLRCVYVQPKGGQVNIYSYNKTLQFRARSQDKISPPTPIPFPLFLVGLLENEDIVEVHWKKTYVALIFKSGQIWESISQKAKTGFPASQIDFYMNKSAELAPLFTHSTRKFASVLIRLGQYLGAVRRQDWLLVLTGQAGSKDLVLTSSAPQTVFRERIHLAQPLKQSFLLNWPLDQLLPVFDFLQNRDQGLMQVRLKKDTSYISTKDVTVVVPGKK